MGNLCFGAFLVIGVFWLPFGSTNQSEDTSNDAHQYCIIGAGPGGIQMAYFLHKANRDYVVYERNNISGSFYEKFPRHRTLISINKRYTGRTNKEFNLRHDWNSLLSDNDNLLFTKYSKEFFPHADRMVEYLNDFSAHFNLNIRYNTNITRVSTYNNIEEDALSYKFILTDQESLKHKCGLLLVATGWSKPHIPDYLARNTVGKVNILGYEDMSLNPEDYADKSVLILGKGNSGFETANHIMGSTAFIHITGHHRVTLAWETHYVGDLRAVNNGLLDTYQLKSLDGVMEAELDAFAFKECPNNKICTGLNWEAANDRGSYDNSANRLHYDVIIRCLGFTYDNKIFDENVKPKKIISKDGNASEFSDKFPPIDHGYKTSTPGMYVVGAITHSLDYKKSAGGFIHGFRYTTRALFHLLQWEHHAVPWPSRTYNLNHLVSVLFKRFNEVSGNYQMFTVLGEVILLNQSDDSFTHLEEFPIALTPEIDTRTGHSTVGRPIVIIAMEYGANFSYPGADTFKQGRDVGGYPDEAYKSNFLHFVFYYYKETPSSEAMKNREPDAILPIPDNYFVMSEDFVTDWTAANSHILQARRWFEAILSQDRRGFTARSCFQTSLSYASEPRGCAEFGKGRGVYEPPDYSRRFGSNDFSVPPVWIGAFGPRAKPREEHVTKETGSKSWDAPGGLRKGKMSEKGKLPSNTPTEKGKMPSNTLTKKGTVPSNTPTDNSALPINRPADKIALPINTPTDKDTVAPDDVEASRVIAKLRHNLSPPDVSSDKARVDSGIPDIGKIEMMPDTDKVLGSPGAKY